MAIRTASILARQLQAGDTIVPRGRSYEVKSVLPGYDLTRIGEANTDAFVVIELRGNPSLFVVPADETVALAVK